MHKPLRNLNSEMLWLLVRTKHFGGVCRGDHVVTHVKSMDIYAVLHGFYRDKGETIYQPVISKMRAHNCRRNL